MLYAWQQLRRITRFPENEGAWLKHMYLIDLDLTAEKVTFSILQRETEALSVMCLRPQRSFLEQGLEPLDYD